jgi:hypothetical protein
MSEIDILYSSLRSLTEEGKRLAKENEELREGNKLQTEHILFLRKQIILIKRMWKDTIDAKK